MIDWFRRVFGRSDEDERQRFLKTIDALNAEAGRGEPCVTTKVLGRLKLRSGVLTLADPQYLPGLEVPNIAGDTVEISASLWRYPSGAALVASLMLRFGELAGAGARRRVGGIGIDSAKLVVGDKADIEEHWTETGKDRIGVISTAPNDTVLRLLTKRFQLTTRRVNRVRAEVVGPVSEQLAEEIEAFLKADPKYADFPFLHFWVQTNNSFERANYLAKAWDFIPIGNSPTPLMFVSGTGRGDGRYDVWGEFVGECPRIVTVTFIED